MTKPELGTKRLCVHCGAKFYDLNQSPIACPKCGAVFEPVQVSTRWHSKGAGEAAREVEPVAAETQELRFVAQEDANVEAQSKEKSGEAHHQAEDEAGLDGDLDDAAFIEEKEDTDVTDIIGDDIEIEKGT